MGVSQSKTSVDVVNQSIITAITNNVNSCSSSLNQNQQVSLSGVGIFNWFSQSASLNVQCLQQATMTNDLSMQSPSKFSKMLKHKLWHFYQVIPVRKMLPT